MECSAKFVLTVFHNNIHTSRFMTV